MEAVVQHHPVLLPLLSAHGATTSGLITPEALADADARHAAEANGSSLPDPQCQSAAAESQADAAVGGAKGGRKRRAQSEARASRFRGVQWDKNGARWRARLHTDKTRHIGYFTTEEDAAEAYDLAFLRHYGAEQAGGKLNFQTASIAKYRGEGDATAAAAAAGLLQRMPSIISAGGSDDAGSKGGGGGGAGRFRGVKQQRDGLFKAVLLKKRKEIAVGLFPTAEEAARAYDRAAIEASGWGALTNFPISDYEGEGLVVRAGFPSQGHMYSQYSLRTCHLQRAGSVPAGLPHQPSSASLGFGAMPFRQVSVHDVQQLQRQASVHSLQQLQRHASMQNLQQFQAAVAVAAAAAAAPPLPANGGALYTPQCTFPLHPAPGMANVGPMVPPANTGVTPIPPRAVGSGPETAVLHDRKRPRLGSGAPATAAAARADPGLLRGVRQLPTGAWLAELTLDLGVHATQDEAMRAYDRAALVALGFTGRTHAPLADAIARSSAAAAAAALIASSGPPQLLPVRSGAPRYHGITHRAGAFLATLDLGGKPYELGPFASEALAANATATPSCCTASERAPTRPFGSTWRLCRRFRRLQRL